jgi:flavin reductase (DIM6/NTAB) family NADH-FMN oxidoreductase RutF/DNA-binding IclR family transcriptional regulator
MKPGSYTAASDERHFRNVLGQFPTGVAVVTALDASGDPVGMAVGSFGSVSLQPPLISFMPARSSSTYPLIAKAEHFCVSILGAEQEDVCRAMATKGGNKFENVDWFPAPSGAPIIAGSLAWVDCTLLETYEAGDHLIVVAAVDDLAELKPALPLVFFRGGYGAITTSSLVAAPERDLIEPLRLAGWARPTIEKLAADLGLECIAVAAIDGHVVSLAVSDAPGADYVPSNVGYRTPLIAPTGSVFVAWSRSDSVSWLNSHPAGDTADEAALTRVRKRRWSVAVGDPQYDLLERTVGRSHLNGSQKPELGQIMGNLRVDLFDLELDDTHDCDVRLLTAPIFDSLGVALAIAVRGFDRHLNGAEIAAIAKRVVAAADTVSREIGGGEQLDAAIALSKELAHV